MKVSADAQMSEADFIGTKHFARTTDRVVFGVVEIVMVGYVDANLGREELGVKCRFFRSRIAVQPGPIGESERLGLLRFRLGGGRFGLDSWLGRCVGTANKPLSFSGRRFSGIGNSRIASMPLL